MRTVEAEELKAFLLTGTRTAKVAVIRADGSPLVTPVWFLPVAENSSIIFTAHDAAMDGRSLGFAETGFRARSGAGTGATASSSRRRSQQGSSRRAYYLRHSFVSLLIAERRTIIEVSASGGHSPAMTLDTHGHVFDELEDADPSPLKN